MAPPSTAAVSRSVWAVVFVANLIVSLGSSAVTTFEWQDLPELPEGLGGHFAGVHNDVLIVAGGANFSAPRPAGEKIYREGLYVLEPGAASWSDFGALSNPRAYGVSASTPEGVWIVGGTDGRRNFDDMLRLSWEADSLQLETPSPLQTELPGPLAMGGGAVIDGTLYVVGGQNEPDGPATAAFYSLELTDPAAEWTVLSAGPVTPRILPVVVARDGALYVFSGAALEPQEEGGFERRYLTDAFRYTPGSGWESLTGPPRPTVAAPAFPYGVNHIFVFGGDDGSLAGQGTTLGADHPGFARDILAYHTITDAWAAFGEMPVSYVTTTAVPWQGRIVIPGGEDKPAYRGQRVLSGDLVVTSSRLNAWDYAALCLYLAVLVGMGFYFSRREKSTDVFFLGGRRVPWWAVGLSIFGTSLSAITYLSIPARAYATDWVFFLANMGIVLIAPIVVYYYIPRFRVSPITTAYEYLENRFNLLTRIYGSLCFMAFQTVRVSIVLFLPAIALSAATGMNIYLCIGAMGLLATLYTVLGGIEAVIWTDVLQAIVLVLGALLGLALIVVNVDGGLSAIVSTATDAEKFHMLNWSWSATTASVWVILIGNAFSAMYPSTADQTIVQRYLSTRSVREARKAVWTNAALTIPITLLFFSLGTALWAYFRTHPEALDPRLQNDAVLPLFIIQEFPAGLRGVIIAGIFAAAMSSLDSSINSVSSVLVNDYYRRWARNVNERAALILARVLTTVFGLFGTLAAVYVARLEATSLWDPFLEFLGLIGGGLAGIFALGVFTKRANGPGAIVGAIVSAIVLSYVRQTDAHPHVYGLVGFTTAFIVGYIASRIMSESSQKT